MSRRVGTAGLVLHHLRSRPGGALTVAALILLLSLLATAAPFALGVLADASLRERLAALGPVDRDVQTTQPGLPQIDYASLPVDPTAEQVWGALLAAVAEVTTAAEPVLADRLDAARIVTLVADMPVFEDPDALDLSLAFDPDFADVVELVDGRMPEPAAQLVSADGSAIGTRMEVLFSADSAAQMQWAVGETRTTGSIDRPTQTVLTGTFRAVDPEADYWQHVPSVLSPKIFDDGNGPRKVTGTAFAHPASLASTYTLTGAPTTTVWYPLDTQAVDSATAAELAAALRKFTSVSHTIGTTEEGAGILSLRFTADVTTTIEVALSQQAATTAVLAMVVAGPVGVAAAVLILGCRLMLERRRASLRLLSARGASTGQLRGLLGLEGVVVGVLPAALGAAIAIVPGMVIFGGTPVAADIIPSVILAMAPAGILVVMASSAAERRERADLGGRTPRLRPILEGAVVTLAILAVVLLFLRGYGGANGSELDLLQAAAPLLLSLVACLITLRLYPLPLGAVFARSRRSVTLNAFLGSARALREPTIGLTPVLALVVGVSVAVSSGVLLSALQGGLEQSAQSQVGADLRVNGATFTAEQLEQVRAIDGVDGATGISGAEVATFDIGQNRPTSVFVVDAAELRAVQGEGPGLLPPGSSLEPTADVMPIVVAGATERLIDGSDDVRIDGVPAEVVGVVSGPSPIGSRENWVAIDSSYAPDVLGSVPAVRTLLVRLTERASTLAVTDALRSTLGGGIRVASAFQIATDIRSSPAVQGVRWALLAANGVAALLSALAIVMTLTLAAGARARVVALLRTLGAPPRAAGALALWEIGPPAVAAVIAGTIFGALVPLVVLAGVDLRSFTGSSVQPAYQVDAATLAITLGGFLLLAALLTAGAMVISRRVRAAAVLRTAEEG